MFLHSLKFQGDLLTVITWALLCKLKKKQTELHGPNFFFLVGKVRISCLNHIAP